MSEIDDIKRHAYELLKRRDVILIAKEDYGYSVQQWFGDGVAPTSDYDTPQEAVARACQILKLTEPVTPQDWPEIAQIGGPSSPPPKPL